MKKYTLLLIAFFTVVTFSYGKSYVSYDATMESIDLADYLPKGKHALSGTFQNTGASAFSSITIHWQLNDGEIFSEEISGFEVEPDSSFSFTTEQVLDLQETGDYHIKVWLSAPNGGEDSDPENNELSKSFKVWIKVPQKRVLLEEGTGTWCGWCPDGARVLHQLKDKYQESLIGIAIHNGDAMATDECDELVGRYISFFPGAIIDRHYFNDGFCQSRAANAWDRRINEQLEAELHPVLLGLIHDYDPQRRIANINLDVLFLEDLTGEYRVNLYVVEDSIPAVGNGYAQENYLDDIEDGRSPLQNWWHNHVLRDMLSGVWGAAHIIDMNPKEGQSFRKVYRLGIPEEWDDQQIKLVGVVHKYDENNLKRCEILNAVEIKLGQVSGIKENEFSTSLGVFPNPTSGETYLSVGLRKNSNIKVNILSQLGQLVFTKDMGNYSEGKHQLVLDTRTFSSGMYFVNVITGNQVITKSLVVK